MDLDIEATRKKARAAIRPLKTVSSDFFGGNRTEAGRELPEYYLVYFLLVDLLGFENPGRHEKIAWSIPVDLNGAVLFIEHRKFGLGVFSAGDHEAEEAAAEVVRLVKKGIRAAQPYFDWRAEIAVKKSEVNVRNLSIQLYERFQFLLNLYEAKCSEPEEFQEIGSLGLKVPVTQIWRESEWLGFSVVESFFSWTEHVFIHLAVLQGECTTGDEVKDLAASEWNSKFKAALDISDLTVKRYYDGLVSIRNEVRNFVAHGAFGKDSEAFLFHSGAGAVPVQLPNRQGQHSYRFRNSLSLSRENRGSSVDEAIVLIQDFSNYIRSWPLSPAWIYLDSGVDLVLSMALDGVYSRAMASEETMRELTEEISYLADMHMNMDF